MLKNKKIIVGNWKMNPASLEEAKKIFSSIRRKAGELKKTSVVICPPALFAGALAKSAGDVSVGLQNIFWENSGPFTGEIGPAMAKSAGISFSIIGHSERRVIGETDAMINKKNLAAVKEGLVAIFCIGEKERDSQGAYFEILKNQLVSGLEKFQKKYLENLIIAYEPVWAIGKSEAMGSGNIQEMSIFIKKIISDMFGKEFAVGVPILYGGSVSPKNCAEILEKGNIDGLLVGRDSLDADSFGEILRAAELAN